MSTSIGERGAAIRSGVGHDRTATGDLVLSCFGGVIDRAIDADADLNLSALAHRLGITESTLRGWRFEQRGPSFSLLCRIFPKMPAGMQDDVLAQLTRGTSIRFFRTEIEQQDRRRNVRDLAVVQQRSGVDLLAEVLAAVEDSRITSGELEQIISRANQQKRNIDSVVAAASSQARR